VRRVNIASPRFSYDGEDAEGFRAGTFRLGPDLGAARLGSARLGATVYELAPGQAVCPYHYEYGEEEWLLVLEGRPTVRHPEGQDELASSDVVRFGVGPEGAHGVRNETEETVRVLMFSNSSTRPSRSTPTATRSASAPRASATTWWSGARARSTTTTASASA